MPLFQLWSLSFIVISLSSAGTLEPRRSWVAEGSVHSRTKLIGDWVTV